MNIPFTDLHAQYIEAKTEIDYAIANTIANNSFINGPDVNKFEVTLAEYLGVPAVASTGSGTTALQVALKACGIGLGDEVITTSHTFISTVEAIVNVGATPIMVDIDEYYHIHPEDVEQVITRKTAAILAMDAYGQSCDIHTLRKIADAHDLWLINDSAHSFGAAVMNVADLNCFSFNPIKNFGAMGDAGAVVGSKELIERCRMIRDHGRNTKFVFQEVGYNARIDNMQANILLAKLPYIKNWNNKRAKIAQRYDEALANVVGIPKTNGISDHVYHVYVIEVIDRNGLAKFLKENGIATNIHYPIPCHLQPAFKKYSEPLPICEYMSDHILSLPCYHTLSADSQDYIIQKIYEWTNK
jgi:dTDP-4-amino-4,6-dideoxygalactose transaminase